MSRRTKAIAVISILVMALWSSVITLGAVFAAHSWAVEHTLGPAAGMAFAVAVLASGPVVVLSAAWGLGLVRFCWGADAAAGSDAPARSDLASAKEH